MKKYSVGPMALLFFCAAGLALGQDQNNSSASAPPNPTPTASYGYVSSGFGSATPVPGHRHHRKPKKADQGGVTAAPPASNGEPGKAVSGSALPQLPASSRNQAF